jgi:acetylornithine deacetylase/succinyl-diaminopimelate desuccinylase-like protein
MRLVPDQDPDKILGALRAYLVRLAPSGVSLEVVPHTSSPPVLLGADHAPARAAMDAWEQATGSSCVLVRTGGSIPVTTAFAEAVDAPMIISGVSSKDSGAHAPNEKLRLENYYAGIRMMIRLMQGIADA